MKNYADELNETLKNYVTMKLDVEEDALEEITDKIGRITRGLVLLEAKRIEYTHALAHKDIYTGEIEDWWNDIMETNSLYYARLKYPELRFLETERDKMYKEMDKLKKEMEEIKNTIKEEIK